MDFSDCAMRAIDCALNLVDRFHSKLTLLSSVAPQYFVTNEEYARYDFPNLLRETEIILRQQMLDLVAKIREGGRKVDGMIVLGHPGQQICAQARNYDLIVISTHGRTGFQHVLLGSTAEYVIRHAQIPVLVVPSRERPRLNWKMKPL
jgi:universal stress protein A